MNAHTRPSAGQIQPMGFRGSLVAIRAPTPGKARKDTKTSRSSAIPLLLAGSQLLGTWTDRPRTNSATFAADMASVRQASDHASQAAARVFVPPTPRARSLVPAVTTPLYSTTVSQALRRPLRGRGENELLRTALWRSSRSCIIGFLCIVLAARCRDVHKKIGGPGPGQRVSFGNDPINGIQSERPRRPEMLHSPSR